MRDEPGGRAQMSERCGGIRRSSDGTEDRTSRTSRSASTPPPPPPRPGPFHTCDRFKTFPRKRLLRAIKSPLRASDRRFLRARSHLSGAPRALSGPLLQLRPSCGCGWSPGASATCVTDCSGGRNSAASRRRRRCVVGRGWRPGPAFVTLIPQQLRRARS